MSMPPTTRQSLYASAKSWWKRLEKDKPLTGKEIVELQYFLSRVCHYTVERTKNEKTHK